MVPCTSQMKGIICVVSYSLRGCTSDRMMIAVQYQIQKGLSHLKCIEHRTHLKNGIEMRGKEIHDDHV